jgi:hypothetical protein
MQQVRAKVYGKVRETFDYLFGATRSSFEPIFDRGDALMPPEELGGRWERLNVIPPEHYPWFRVTGLRPKEQPEEDARYQIALQKMSPSEGAFIMMSTHRRSKAK